MFVSFCLSVWFLGFCVFFCFPVFVAKKNVWVFASKLLPFEILVLAWGLCDFLAVC